jgi:mono/diheme cytochrome c family protein
MDASVARAAPKMANPISADEANLAAGARLYRDHCTLCHGDPARPKASLAESLNPPVPQFMDGMADMPENQNFYILQHGIRWTAMPGWGKVLSEKQTWQLVTFLSHLRDLPRSQASFHGIQRCDRSRPQATMNGRMQRVFRFTLADSWIGGTGECRGR